MNTGIASDSRGVEGRDLAPHIEGGAWILAFPATEGANRARITPARSPLARPSLGAPTEGYGRRTPIGPIGPLGVAWRPCESLRASGGAQQIVRSCLPGIRSSAPAFYTDTSRKSQGRSRDYSGRLIRPRSGPRCW